MTVEDPQEVTSRRAWLQDEIRYGRIRTDWFHGIDRLGRDGALAIEGVGGHDDPGRA